MNNHFFSDKTIVPAIVPVSKNNAALVAAEVDATGWERVCFIVSTGAMGAGTTLNVEVTESNVTGGTFTAHTPSTAITELAAATGASKVVAIDMAVNFLKPILLLSGTTATSGAVLNSAVAVLYNRGGAIPVTAAASFREEVRVD